MHLLKTRKFWLGLAGLVTVFAGVIYITMQQSWRMAADLPQQSMAADAARDVSQGRSPQEITVGYIDMSQRAAPFLIIYDQFGQVVAGNGYLDNEVPQVPIGVLSSSKGSKNNNITWQPKDGVRIASSTAKAGDYYVLGGRSLAETENKISTFTKWLVGLWVLGLVVIIVGYKLFAAKKHKN